jgi:hypothetical protein
MSVETPPYASHFGTQKVPRYAFNEFHRSCSPHAQSGAPHGFLGRENAELRHSCRKAQQGLHCKAQQSARYNRPISRDNPCRCASQGTWSEIGRRAGRAVKLPGFFKDEAELRALWSDPGTRKKLLEGLAEAGFGHDQLSEMQKIIDAEKSDLFDVLAHVAYAMPTLTREERADNAKPVISSRFNTKQQMFLDFVLSHYVSMGVDELDQEKLTPLLRLKYHNSIADAVTDLGRPEEISKVFVGFQKFLYQEGPRV